MLFAVVYGIILIEVAIVAWIDFKRELISNYWVILNVGFAVILPLILPGLYPVAWEILLFPVGFLIIGFILFLFHVMGAGDSKYLASLFLLVPLEQQLIFFEKLVLSTISTGAILLTIRILKEGRTIRAYLVSSYWYGIKKILRSRFSYAPVILIAWVLFGLSYNF